MEVVEIAVNLELCSDFFGLQSPIRFRVRRCCTLIKWSMLCVYLTCVYLAWEHICNNGIPLPCPKLSSYINNMETTKESPIRTIANQFFRLETGDKLTREAFVSVLEKNVHLFSAIGYNSSDGLYYDNIVLSGWEYKTFDLSNNYTCCFIYDVSSIEIVATRMVEKRDWIMKAKLESKQFVCPNVLHSKRKVPYSVSLGVAGVCQKTMNTYMKVDLPMKQPGDKLAVCSKLIFGNISASAVVEWFEYQQLMNVSKVLGYVSNVKTDVMNVLQYYVSKGLAEFYHFSLPEKDKINRVIGMEKFQSWNDEQVSVFDCSIRLAGYKYIALYDLDEYVYPKKDGNVLELMRTLHSLNPNAAGFTFKTEQYITTWGEIDKNAQSPADMMINSYNQRTDPMEDRVKSMIITDRMRPGGLSTHTYWIKPSFENFRRYIPPELATLKHFRKCRKQWLGMDGECSLQHIKDESMFGMADKIRDSVNRVKTLLKLT